MTGKVHRPGLSVRFRKLGPGNRFCLTHSPPEGIEIRAAMVYVHPFGEELNKSRRMASLQSKRFAAGGIHVLQMDLFGCGDSAGELDEASWDIWLEDVAAAVRWTHEETGLRPGLWGLRLGAMLAAEAASLEPIVNRLLLWQPVVSGKQFLTQFLRLKLAASMFQGSAGEASGGLAEIRDSLAAGKTIEISGYGLNPGMAQAIEARQMASLDLPGRSVDWLEVAAEVDPSTVVGGAARRVAERWRSVGTDVRTASVVGDPFWTSTEIVECPALLDATSRAMDV